MVRKQYLKCHRYGVYEFLSRLERSCQPASTTLFFFSENQADGRDDRALQVLTIETKAMPSLVGISEEVAMGHSPN